MRGGLGVERLLGGRLDVEQEHQEVFKLPGGEGGDS